MTSEDKTQFYSCIECSNHFKAVPKSSPLVGWWRFTCLLPEGVGICKKCQMYGPGPIGKRRSWDPKFIDEDPSETWNGVSDENDPEYWRDRPSEKNLWWERFTGRWKVYSFHCSWLNSFNGRKRIGDVKGFPVCWYSVSQKNRIEGWIHSIDGDEVTVMRNAVDEKEKAQGNVFRRKLHIRDIHPPEAARDGPLDFNLVKCSLCGLSHSEHRVSKVWKGRSVCKECSHKELTRERPPDYAGDINHIGFKKGTECGCWSCSGSDLNSNIYHKCGQCMKYSNNGWVDRKTGDDTWFCRDCWLLYFKEFKLVHISTMKPTMDGLGPNYYNGIWIPKDSDGSDVSKEQIQIVKAYHKTILY